MTTMPRGQNHVLFESRRAAGRALADELARRRSFDLVLGLHRGGVPVGYEVARAMGVPLDVLVVKKLRVPHGPDLAIGTVAEGALILHEEVIRVLGVSAAYVEVERDARLTEARATEQRCRGGLTAPDLKGRDIVIVDDGTAPWAKAEVAVRSARWRGAARVVVAFPATQTETRDRLWAVSDELVCLAEPTGCVAVGRLYRRFEPISDEEERLLVDRTGSGGERAATGTP